MKHSSFQSSVLNQILMSGFSSLVVIGFVIVGLGLLASNSIDLSQAQEGFEILNNGGL